MTQEAREAIEAATQPRVRVDWRTGRPMVEHGEAYWRDHEQRRLGQGLSVSQYCAANGLALSTYRHRANGKKRTSANRSAPKPAPSQPATFMPVSTQPTQAAELVEISLNGMTLRLSGVIADRVQAGVMARLA